MQDIPILLEHVDLLNAGDGLHPQLLERRLELSVVPLGRGDRLFHYLASGSALAAFLSAETNSDDDIEFARRAG